MLERELTFLIKEIPAGLADCVSKEMVDLYIPASSNHPHTRIRKNGEAYEFTNKKPIHDGDASQQLERTVILDQDEFQALQSADGKKIEKTRYYYAENGYQYEIDVFGGDLTGLVLVDVEFDDDESQQQFVMPDWCLGDVTQETFVAGGMLAGKLYADIETELGRFNYQRQYYEKG